jgi:hypothetical protein
MKTLSERRFTRTVTMTYSICGGTSKGSSRSITIGSDCTRRWAIDLRKNLEDRANVEARQTLEVQPMQFFENGESEMWVSPELSGEGDSNAVPFPRPQPLLGDAKTLK